MALDNDAPPGSLWVWARVPWVRVGWRQASLWVFCRLFVFPPNVFQTNMYSLYVFSNTQLIVKFFCSVSRSWLWEKPNNTQIAFIFICFRGSGFQSPKTWETMQNTWQISRRTGVSGCSKAFHKHTWKLKKLVSEHVLVYLVFHKKSLKTYW